MEWTRDIVADRFREAWETLRRVPAHGVPGFKTHWPDYIHDLSEGYGYTGVTLRLARASPQAIDRMMETFGWFRFLAGRPHLGKAVWLTCGAGMGPRRASGHLGVHRDTVRARREEALELILAGLRGAG